MIIFFVMLKLFCITRYAAMLVSAKANPAKLPGSPIRPLVENLRSPLSTPKRKFFASPSVAMGNPAFDSR
jgi:hypothetical protein